MFTSLKAAKSSRFPFWHYLEDRLMGTNSIQRITDIVDKGQLALDKLAQITYDLPLNT